VKSQKKDKRKPAKRAGAKTPAAPRSLAEKIGLQTPAALQVWPIRLNEADKQRLAVVNEELDAELARESTTAVPSNTQAEQVPNDWREKLRVFRDIWDDDRRFLEYGHALNAAMQLAGTTDSIEEETRIDNLWRMYPGAATKLGLPKPPESESAKKATYSRPGLELRDEKARAVAQDLVNFSLPQGSTYADQIQEIAKQLNWHIEPLPDDLRKSPFPRGRTVFGAADKVLGEIAESHGLKWIVERGVLRFTATPPTTEASANSKNRGGRPRKDDEREKVRVKHTARKDWKQIAKEMNEETGQEKTPEAYRALLRSPSANPAGKNVQN
jgi:hypothetical protein